MSLKWTRNQSDSGILRKSESKEKKEELFVFGYSCKLFRDDDKALHIDQGKHLIPWMGDETLKIDRYDARGALHDLSALEAPPGGFDWRVELTKNEHDVEQLCDEERYRALHTDEDEEEMYKEEELKRLHAAGYGQVGFNYDAPAEPSPTSQTVEVDEPFEPTTSFKALLPVDIVLPESLKQNAIIEKTAKFIATQGTQMEILIKAKQGDNPQFQFLVRDSVLHPYYMALIALVKSGKWPEKAPEVVEEKPPENEDYLHPSLASTVIESAPSIPSIHYKPSADCDYTMLISKMRGDTVVEETYTQELAPGEVAPPGTEPLGVPTRDHAQITRAPVMYHTDGAANPIPEQSHVAYQQYAAYYHQYLAQAAQAAQAAQSAQTAQATQLQMQPKNDQPPSTLKSTGLSLMKNYNTDSDSDDSDYDDTSSTDSKDKQQILKPPEDIQTIIDKMASYVARNGDEFAEIVRAKNDPRFTFLDPEHMYHPYYKRLMQEKRGVDVNGKEKREKSKAPVSFSIKKMKEPDPILPKPALPYESSSDEDTEKSDKQTEKVEQLNEPPKINAQLYQVQNMPPVIVYKMDGLLTQDSPSVRTIETVKTIPKILQNPIQTVSEVIETPKEEVLVEKEVEKPEVPMVKEPTPIRDVKKEKSPSPKKEKKRYKEKKKEYKLKSESRESKRSDRRSEEKEKRNEEKEKRKERVREERDRKRSKYKDDLENEIITLEDNSDDLIDLTGDQSDSKGECETEGERAKQLERRRRAAEFLKKVGVDPSAAALPTSSLASAMVDTLELLRKKKAEEEEKRRRREKRRHRERRDYEDERSNRKSKRRKYNRSSDDDSDYDNSKKKKRKKERKHNKSKRKRRREESEEEEQPLPANIDLTNTLKELRNASPTKELMLQEVEVQRQDSSEDDDEENTEKEIKRKKDREYSEGEWSSDSEGDSASDSYDISKRD
ncbi:hypothetical protein K1T71_011435 [Dendrolimus kikuchii]|uniref:Uncharacterized protein n=1 Tax=Dendrolimus kikuchii TaxID=765133 RepID=A0ACC1CPC4_9NEOP|nr:hypothetical protein K1T71_011435 [Dendrolimus kikuchii]